MKLEILAIKGWFSLNLTKYLKSCPFVVGGPINFKFLPNTFFDSAFQKIVL